ncbi:MAG: hypothetical protein ACRDJH_00555 [Thermomicrobiales bacterium]
MVENEGDDHSREEAMMTPLLMEQMADLASQELERRYRRQALFSETTGRTAGKTGVRRWVAAALIALGSRLAPSPAASDVPVPTISSARGASS